MPALEKYLSVYPPVWADHHCVVTVEPRAPGIRELVMPDCLEGGGRKQLKARVKATFVLEERKKK